jgi:hypothetical protein
MYALPKSVPSQSTYSLHDTSGSNTKPISIAGNGTATRVKECFLCGDSSKII